MERSGETVRLHEANKEGMKEYQARARDSGKMKKERCDAKNKNSETNFMMVLVALSESLLNVL